MKGDEQFPKSRRVRRQADFDRVYRSSVYAADSVLVIRAAVNDNRTCRLGLSVSRKVGNAVVRNRWKRLIREAFRRNQNRMPDGLDLVIRPRKGAAPGFEAIQASLIRLSKTIRRRIKQSKSPEG